MEVWGAACKAFMNPILILQKRMTRVITFKDRKHHSNPLFLELNLLDVFKEYRYLKPQDSFGRFVKKILDLQKVDHTIRKHN